jgi:hypothetical protein
MLLKKKMKMSSLPNDFLIKNGILVCYYKEEFLKKAKEIEKSLKFPFFYKKCDEDKILVIKDYKTILISHNLNKEYLKQVIFFYFDVNLGNLVFKKVKEELKKERNKISKEIDLIINEKLREFQKYKKSVDVSMIFRMLLVLFLSILIVKLGSTFFNIILNMIYKSKEMQFIKSLNEDVNNLLKKEDGSFLLKKVELHNNIKYVCFTYPKKLSEVFNKKWEFNEIKNFKFNNEIKKFAEKNQKNIFFIYSKGDKAYISFYKRGLYSSLIEENPLCFKNNEPFYLVTYDGLVFVTKKDPDEFVKEMKSLTYSNKEKNKDDEEDIISLIDLLEE